MPGLTVRQYFRGLRVLLVGLGVHGGGVATARWLIKHGAQLTITDLKLRRDLAKSVAALKSLPIQWRLGRHDQRDFTSADLIVQNPGVPPDLPALQTAVRAGIPVVNEASLFFKYAPGRIIGITGTRGKTTTTLLIAAILRQNKSTVEVSGNVRQTPMLAMIDKLRPTSISVIELSSFQLERLADIKISPALAVMTNLKIDHLNRYHTLKKYIAAKSNIWRFQKRRDLAVLNADDRLVRQLADLTPAKKWWFGIQYQRHQPLITIDRGWVVRKQRNKIKQLFPLTNWTLPGQHQVYNLLAAVAAGMAMNIPPPIIRQAIKKFVGVPYRQQEIQRWHGHRFINDTTATSPDGLLAALENFPQAVFIIGGTDKKLDFKPLVKKLLKGPIKLVFLPGSATKKLQRLLHHRGYRQTWLNAKNMNQAVRLAIRMAAVNDAIVLSPGAASFGLFVHEFDRGDQFNRVVNQLT